VNDYKFLNILCIIILFFLSSCAHSGVDRAIGSRVSPSEIYIEMPRSAQVFENIAPILYDALLKHFERAGFKVVDSSRNCPVLRTWIKKVEPEYKFFSPDLLTYAVKMGIHLECSLIQEDGTAYPGKPKVFRFFTLVSKPKKTIFLSAFLDFEWRRLFERSVPQIDYFFRSHIVGNEKD
jgi:hypothetical protein